MVDKLQSLLPFPVLIFWLYSVMIEADVTNRTWVLYSFNLNEPSFLKFLVSRRDKCKYAYFIIFPYNMLNAMIVIFHKQVFPSFWIYRNVLSHLHRPTTRHTMLHWSDKLNPPFLFILHNGYFFHRKLLSTTVNVINPATKPCTDLIAGELRCQCSNPSIQGLRTNHELRDCKSESCSE